jgi:excisionase family DNA binding protein
MERMLTTEEVAELLRVDAVTVRRLATRGELTAYRIAGEYRFTPSGVESFVESQRIKVDMKPGPEHPFAKFTKRAKRVMSLANEEAIHYNHKGVGTEHILLAIIDEGEGIAAKALEHLQVQPDEVRAQINKLHPPEEQPLPQHQLSMTPQGKQCIELAVREAQSLGHHYLGTEHLLLGLLREEEVFAYQVLSSVGVTLEKTRELIKQLLAKK